MRKVPSWLKVARICVLRLWCPLYLVLRLKPAGWYHHLNVCWYTSKFSLEVPSWLKVVRICVLRLWCPLYLVLRLKPAGWYHQ